jgi:hypothetical protein
MNAPAIIVQAEPLTVNHDEALAFTGFAPKFFDQLERAGRIRGKRIGRRGETRYRTEELRDIVRAVYGIGTQKNIDDEFEGLGEGLGARD